MPRALASQQPPDSPAIAIPPAAPPLDSAPATSRSAGRDADSLTGPDIKLSTAMRRILDDSVPDFVPWTMEHYADEVRWWVRQSQPQPPWAVIGDFNRDSVQDLVIDGTDGRRDLRIALVSNGETFRVFFLKAAPLGQQRVQSIEFLAYQEPTTVDSLACDNGDQCHPVGFHLTADAFQVVFYEKASSVWYWTGSGFASATTSD
jgi:hypothetical protein